MAPKQQPLLEIRGLAKRYGAFQALGGVSFDMEEGEIISVLGPSGCGKSTLLQLVAGLARPDGGEIRLNGQTIASSGVMVPPEKRGVNMVFQDYALWPHMSVFDNIAYGLNKLRREEKTARVAELTELLQLAGLEKRLPPQLSGGQQQRVAIARALATRPRLMLLDEPLSNLDMRLRIEMRTEMAYLFRKLGMSVFHVTHDPEEAFSMADRLLIMRSGAIDQIGTPQECYTRPASRWAASLLGAINRLQGTLVRTSHMAALQVGGALIEGVCGADLDALPNGSPAEVLFRPESLSIAGLLAPAAAAEASAAAEPAAAGGDSPMRNRLEVTVLLCTFEGSRWRSAVETGDGQKLYVLSDSPLAAGSRQLIRLPETGAFLYAPA